MMNGWASDGSFGQVKACAAGKYSCDWPAGGHELDDDLIGIKGVGFRGHQHQGFHAGALAATASGIDGCWTSC
jgi:hypothetical protein